MKRAKAATEALLTQAFEDVEALHMCLFYSRGWERSALEHRVDAGEVVSPLPGLFARSGYWGALTREQQVMHVVKSEGAKHPSWVFSHTTAAIAHGFPVSHHRLWPIHYTTAPGGGGRARRHFAHHRSASTASELRDGIAVTSAVRTVVDCARTLPFGQALAIADAARHRGIVTERVLLDDLESRPGMRGNRQAQRVIALSSPKPESRGESLVRALVLEVGLPEPELQAPVPSLERPGRLYRVDFLFRVAEMAPVALELDGLEKYENAAMTGGRSAVRVMAAERQREAEITASGIRVARIGFTDAIRPPVLLRRLAAYGVVPER